MGTLLSANTLPLVSVSPAWIWSCSVKLVHAHTRWSGLPLVMLRLPWAHVVEMLPRLIEPEPTK